MRGPNYPHKILIDEVEMFSDEKLEVDANGDIQARLRAPLERNPRPSFSHQEVQDCMDKLQDYLLNFDANSFFVYNSDNFYCAIFLPLYRDLWNFLPVNPLPSRTIPSNPFDDEKGVVDFGLLITYMENLMTKYGERLYMPPCDNPKGFLIAFIDDLLNKLDHMMLEDYKEYVILYDEIPEDDSYYEIRAR